MIAKPSGIILIAHAGRCAGIEVGDWEGQSMGETEKGFMEGSGLGNHG